MQFNRVLLTTGEITLLTGISQAKIYADMEKGKLLSRRIGGRRRFLVADVEKYIGYPLPVVERKVPCSRTFLDRDGRHRLDRKFLGPVGGAAIKLDADENVLGGLTIGEGIETCMAGRQIGLKPAWALGSAPAIASFPVLNGIEALWLLRELDSANMHAAIACKARWETGGREVFDHWPNVGDDMNDAIRGRAA